MYHTSINTVAISTMPTSTIASATESLLAKLPPSTPTPHLHHTRVADECRTSMMAVVTVVGVMVGLIVGAFVYVFLAGPFLERFGICRWVPDIETGGKTSIPHNNKLENWRGANFSMLYNWS
jgi:hypothetical protein